MTIRSIRGRLDRLEGEKSPSGPWPTLADFYSGKVDVTAGPIPLSRFYPDMPIRQPGSEKASPLPRGGKVDA